MRRSRPVRWTAVVALVAAVAAMVAWRASASAAESESQPESGTTAHDVRQAPEKAQDYWTPERMEQAQDAPMPKRD